MKKFLIKLFILIFYILLIVAYTDHIDIGYFSLGIIGGILLSSKQVNNL